MVFPLETPENLSVNDPVLNWNWNQNSLLCPVYWKLKADSWIVRIFQCSMCTASCWMHLSVFFLGDLLNPRVVNRMRKFGFAVWSTLLKSAVDMFTSLVSSPIIVTCRICWNTSKTHQPQFCINMLIFRMTNLTSLY